MALAGIGEASSVLAVVQLGFNIATTIFTFFSDIKDANDDIQSLASELDTTSRHLQTLSTLIEDNAKTRGWDENGLALAQKCVIDCERCSKKLRMLLRQSRPDDDRMLAKDNTIKTPYFDKVTWPIYKPQFNVLKQELVLIRVDILLAHTTYHSKVGTAAETSNASKTLVALWRQKKKSQVRLEQAERDRERSRSQNDKTLGTGRKQQNPEGQQTPGRVDGVSKKTHRVVFADSASTTSTNSSISSSVIRQELHNLQEKVKQQVEEEGRKVKEEAENAERLLQQAKQNAIEGYIDELKKASEQRRAAIETTTSMLQASELNLNGKQIKTLLAQLHPPEENDELTVLLRVKPDEAQLPSTSLLQAAENPQSSVSGFRRLFTKLVRSPISSSLHEPLPSVLQDPTQPDGMALIKSFIFLFDIFNSQATCADVHISFGMLASHIRRAQNSNVKDWFGLPKAEFGRLPTWCQKAIATKIDSEVDDMDDAYAWSLLVTQAPWKRNMLGLGRRCNNPKALIVVKLSRDVSRARDENYHGSSGATAGGTAAPPPPKEPGPTETYQTVPIPPPPKPPREEVTLYEGYGLPPTRRHEGEDVVFRRGAATEYPQSYTENEKYEPIDYSRFGPPQSSRSSRPQRNMTKDSYVHIPSDVSYVPPRPLPEYSAYSYDNEPYDGYLGRRYDDTARQTISINSVGAAGRETPYRRYPYYSDTQVERNVEVADRSLARPERSRSRRVSMDQDHSRALIAYISEHDRARPSSHSHSKRAVETPVDVSASETLEAEDDNDDDNDDTIASMIMRKYTGLDVPSAMDKPSLNRQATVEMGSESGSSAPSSPNERRSNDAGWGEAGDPQSPEEHVRIVETDPGGQSSRALYDSPEEVVDESHLADIDEIEHHRLQWD